METPFNKAIHDFLDDRCNDMLDSTEISPGFVEADKESEKLSAQLKPLLDEKGNEILTKLYIQNNLRMVEAAAAGYQKGFAEGIKFILYLSIL